MVGVAGPARLMRVMSQLGSLLPPIDRLDRHVDIQDPRLTQYRFDACPQLAAEPFYPGALLYPAHRPAHHVFTDRAVHVQQRRIEPISPHRVDMRIAPVSAQDRECCRAQYIHHRAPAVAYKRSGVLLTKRSHRPPACRNCAKNNSCPSRVTGASSSNSAKYRPPGVSTGHGSALKKRSPSGSADLTLPSSSIPQKINILLQLPFYSIAVFRLSVADYYERGGTRWLRFEEKRGKEHEVPVHLKAKEAVDLWLERSYL